MPISPGQMLGPYEILAPIGAGGMGEVYRARDTRLNRQVAIKIAAAEFSERFAREATLVASLNHSNICQLYDVGPNYLVMELIDGQSLQGPLPMNKVLKYSEQILDALEAAHKKGITHRDLKPGNILVTKQGVKLLDFGLAKQAAPLDQMDATLVAGLTSAGQILGTLHYMSPEQLQGKDADPRSDLFSFGCVLYEMMIGKRAFEGENAASVIAAILEREPAALIATPSIDRIVSTCLKKDPDQRFQTATDLKRALSWTNSTADAALPAKARRNLPLTIAAAFGVVAVISALWMLAARRAPIEAVRFQIDAGAVPEFRAGVPTVSPNGKQFAMIAESKDARRQISLRPLDAGDMYPVAGTIGANFLTWSPDSSAVAFNADGKLRYVDLASRTIREITDTPVSGGIAWGGEGSLIVQDPKGTGLISIPIASGKPSPATTLDTSAGEVAHTWPTFCPDGKHFLYQASHRDGRRGLRLGVLGSPREWKAVEASLHSVCTEAPGLWGKETYLIELNGTSLIARKFDTNTARFASEPVILAQNLAGGEGTGFNVTPRLSASRAGVVVHRPDQYSGRRFIWHDRKGAVLGTLPSPVVGSSPTLTRDERFLAMMRPGANGGEIWVIDLSRNSSMKLAAGPLGARLPVWSLDGSKIAYSSDDGIYEIDSAGAGVARLLASVRAWPQQYTPDGKHLLFVDYSKRELQLLPLEGDRKPVTIAPPGASFFPASLSPDSRFVAYTSEESGRPEVYVRAMSPASGKWLVSTTGGGMSAWRADGRELFYLSTDLKMMAVDIQLTPAFRVGTPKELFQTRIAGVSSGRNAYVVSNDGNRFLIVTPPEAGISAPTVIVNWHALLRKSALAQ
jgi:Tol biopolymer transport system component/predicted Ser/Thr protein kinase